MVTTKERPLPFDVKQSRTIWMIQTAPPPKPMCFDTLEQWQEYLMYLHASGESITRRQDIGKYGNKPRVITVVFDHIPYCDDCEIGSPRQLRMRSEGRCIVPEICPPSPPTNP